MSARNASARELRSRLADLPAPGSFSEAELEGLPGPVRRYVESAIVHGTPLARSARFRMVGSIRLGDRWVAFRARQIEAPHHGFVWSARAGVIVGSDRYAEGHGAMSWRVLGLVRVMHADGPDVSRSAAGRVGGEAIWVPTALLPRFGVTWTATDPRYISASYRLDEADIELHYNLDDDARVRSVNFDRWGDPDNTGTWGLYPFGFEVTGHSTSTASRSRVPVAPAGSTGPTDGARASSSGLRSPTTSWSRGRADDWAAAKVLVGRGDFALRGVRPHDGSPPPGPANGRPASRRGRRGVKR